MVDQQDSLQLDGYKQVSLVNICGLEVVLFFLSRMIHCFSKNASNFAPDSTDKIYHEFSSDSNHMLFRTLKRE
jgi:hypothetical protein